MSADPSLITGNTLDSASELALVSSRLAGEIANTGGLHAVNDTLGGQVFRDTYGWSYDNPQYRALLQRCGYVFTGPLLDVSGYGEAWVPDPERLLACKQAYDLPIQFVAEAESFGNIPEKTYAEVVRSGHHPIGMSRLLFYKHDLIPNDHFLAVLVGGRPLIEWIVRNNPKSRSLADTYDTVTGDLTSALRACFTKGYDERKFTNTLRAVVEFLHATDDDAEYILGSSAMATDRGREHDLRSLLYEGLQRSGIDWPELLPPPPEQQLGHAIMELPS